MMHIQDIGMQRRKAHNSSMRTTITLDDPAQEIATLYAESRDISLSKAICELVVRAVDAKPRIKYIDGFPVFDVPRGEIIPNERAKEIEADEF
jgi:hypothetical protein